MHRHAAERQFDGRTQPNRPAAQHHGTQSAACRDALDVLWFGASLGQRGKELLRAVRPVCLERVLEGRGQGRQQIHLSPRADARQLDHLAEDAHNLDGARRLHKLVEQRPHLAHVVCAGR